MLNVLCMLFLIGGINIEFMMMYKIFKKELKERIEIERERVITEEEE